MSLEESIKATTENETEADQAEESLTAQVNKALENIPESERGLFKLMLVATIGAMALADPALDPWNRRRILSVLTATGVMLRLEALR